jgi:hypothetical protein
MSQEARRTNRMDQIISGFVDGVLVPVINVFVTGGLAFAVFALLWVGFGAALIWSQGSLDASWQWIRALPFLVQGIVWLLFLPVVVGLWIWETAWPLVVRLALVVALAGWNLWIFLPRALVGGKP